MVPQSRCTPSTEEGGCNFVTASILAVSVNRSSWFTRCLMKLITDFFNCTFSLFSLILFSRYRYNSNFRFMPWTFDACSGSSPGINTILAIHVIPFKLSRARWKRLWNISELTQVPKGSLSHRYRANPVWKWDSWISCPLLHAIKRIEHFTLLSISHSLTLALFHLWLVNDNIRTSLLCSGVLD